MKSIVIFTKDFANKKKGEEFECGSLLASDLVRKDKVAKFKETEEFLAARKEAKEILAKDKKRMAHTAARNKRKADAVTQAQCSSTNQ